jgi:hypothetical protein
MAVSETSTMQAVAGFNPKGEFGDRYRSLLFEQYKLYVESSNNVSDRRGNTQTFLLTANTLLVTIYALVAGKDVAIDSAARSWQLLIPLAGLLVAITWFALIQSYRSLNRAKFYVILSMENELPVRCFGLEWERLRHNRPDGHLALSRIEQVVPLIFGGLYIAMGVAGLH